MLIEDFTIENDWVIQPVQGTDAALCPKCQMVLPLKKFRRSLSRAQVKAWGYQGGYKYETHSRFCVDCQPRKRWLTELTPTEIGWLIKNGDIDPVTAAAVLDERERTKNQKKSAAMSERWHKIYADAWEKILDEQLRPLANMVNVQAHRARKKLAGAHAEYKPTYQPLVDFFTEYQRIIAVTRARIQMRTSTARAMPTTHEWRDYVSDEDKQKAREMWNAIPAEAKMYYNTPDLLSKNRPDRQPMVEREGHIGITSEAKERLSHIM